METWDKFFEKAKTKDSDTDLESKIYFIESTLGHLKEEQIIKIYNMMTKDFGFEDTKSKD